MATNLLGFVKDQLTDAAYSKIGSLIGESASSNQSAIASALPTILKAVVNRGDTTDNARELMGFIGENDLGGNLLSSFMNMGDGRDTDSFLSKGADVLDWVFGSAKQSMLERLIGNLGFSMGKGTKLLSILAPLALNFISRLAKSNNYDDAQLGSYLKGQKEHLMGLGGESVSHGSDDNTSGGGGWWKWLLPLLLLLAAIWYFTKDGCGDANSTDTTEVDGYTDGDNDADGTATISSGKTNSNGTKGTNSRGDTHTHEDGTVHSGESHDNDNDVDGATTTYSYYLDANGNIVDASGKILYKKGDFKKEGEYYVDKSGKKISLLSKIGKAIGGVASQTAGAFKSIFTGLFSSKEKVGSKYQLSKIVFDRDSHRITDFSKNEVEGLASALKSLPGAKIQVQVHTNDGSGGKENNEFTKLRAEVVRDMLVTLGVNKGQISFKGMGSDDAVKAAADKVEIMVEQTVMK